MTKFTMTIPCMLGLLTRLSACGNTGSSSNNMEPVGDGLHFLGISAVVAVLVAVIGLSRMGGGKSDG